MGALFTTWLALIALQALGTKGAGGRVGEFFADADRLLERALDPTVPAIPDLRTTAKAPKAPKTAATAPDTTPDTTPRLRVPQAV